LIFVLSCGRGSAISFIFARLQQQLNLSFAGEPLTTPTRTSRRFASPHVLRRDGRFNCSVCNRSYVDRAHCLDHLHSHTGNTTCKICHKIYAHKESLDNHMAKHRGSIRCRLCNHTFVSQSILNRHVRTSQACMRKRAR